MSTRLYGSVWSREMIDSEPLPIVPKALLPWLRKDRREAEEGGTFYDSQSKAHVHDRSGLVYAERELRRLTADLASAEPTSDRAAILRHQLAGQEEQVEFWRGKVYLLDRVIAATEGRP